MIDVAVGVRDATPPALNTLLALLTLVVADRYLTRFSVSAVVRLAALFGLVIASALPAMILIGMEYVPHLLLTIWFTRRRGRTGTHARRRARISLDNPLVRACRVAGSLSLRGLLPDRDRVPDVRLSPPTVARRPDSATACAPAVAFGAISVMNGAFFFPNSLMLKAASGSASGLAVLLKPIGSEDLAFLQHNLPLLAVAVVSLVGAAVHAIKRRGMSRPHVLLPLWLPPAILLHGHLVSSSYILGLSLRRGLAGPRGFRGICRALGFRFRNRHSGAALEYDVRCCAGDAGRDVANYKEATVPRAEIAA